MNEAEYAAWIRELVDQGVYSPELGEDFIRQRAEFEQRFRSRIVAGDSDLPGAVGYAAEQPFEAPSAPELVARASQRYEGRAIYFESLTSWIR